MRCHPQRGQNRRFGSGLEPGPAWLGGDDELPAGWRAARIMHEPEHLVFPVGGAGRLSRKVSLFAAMMIWPEDSKGAPHGAGRNGVPSRRPEGYWQTAPTWPATGPLRAAPAFLLVRLAPAIGLEPITYRLTAGRSAD
jgi:hypothetical protein